MKFHFVCKVNGSQLKLSAKANTRKEAKETILKKYQGVEIVGDSDNAMGLKGKSTNRHKYNRITKEEWLGKVKLKAEG